MPVTVWAPIQPSECADLQASEVLRSLTFRYIAQYVTVLSGTVFIAMGAFYLYFSYTSFEKLADSVLDEMQTLQRIYREQDLAGVQRYIDGQAATPWLHRYSYLITDAAGRKVAGNLPAAPRYREFPDGWLGFELALQDWGAEIGVDFLARPGQLGDGYRVMVARDYADIVERARLVFSNLLRVTIVTILFGLVGGYLSAASTLRRVEKLNRDISRIIRSDPRQRLEVSREQGYVRTLALVVNQMLEQMETLMQGVRRVADNIAHDLRTPLTRIRNDLSQLRSRQVVDDTREQLDRILEECDDLLASFNASLRISALESGNRSSGGGEIELRSLLADVVELYEPLAQERDIEVRLDAPEPRVCFGEADLLFQMLANVLDNAVKYTPRGGSIQVRLSAAGDSDADGHLVVVADTGPGIPAVERKNVFRRFYRVESSRGEQPGHGLGLSLVQAIAQYHGGSVELGSNNPGLQVRIKLP